VGAVASVAALLAAGSANSAVIANFPDFTDVSKLKLNGDAQQAPEGLRLTEASKGQTGSAFTRRAGINPSKSFKAEFTYLMYDTTSFPGDGMAFVVHSNGKGVIGDGGGGLGFGSIGDSVAVEFDTFDNGGDDEDANEVAIIVNGKAGKSRDASIPAFSLYGTGQHFAWVTYKASSHMMKVYVTYQDPTRPDTPEVAAKVNLEKILDGKGRAGFTAATGGANAIHLVTSWKMSQ
jgi:hypothetical protein